MRAAAAAGQGSCEADGIQQGIHQSRATINLVMIQSNGSGGSGGSGSGSGRDGGSCGTAERSRWQLQTSASAGSWSGRAHTLAASKFDGVVLDGANTKINSTMTRSNGSGYLPARFVIP